MASIPGIPAGDRRRSQRVLIRVPVHLHGFTKQGKRVNEKSEAIVVSRSGALLKTESELKPGSDVDLENPSSHQSARFRVVWTSDRRTEGRWDIGIEFRSGDATIWGIEFPATESQRKQKGSPSG
ncbi:MAG: PilZ domain-containing protein [Terriglobia bacterium]